MAMYVWKWWARRRFLTGHTENYSSLRYWNTQIISVTEIILRNILQDKRTRTVKHYQFTSWPDHGVPDSPSSVLDFVREIRSSVQAPHGPMVVHCRWVHQVTASEVCFTVSSCSAGVGRTGTFIALDTLLQHTKDHDWVDIFGLACEMRLHRNHMIQTEVILQLSNHCWVFISHSMLSRLSMCLYTSQCWKCVNIWQHTSRLGRK